MLGDGLPRHRPTSGPRHAYSWGCSGHLAMALSRYSTFFVCLVHAFGPHQDQRVAGQPFPFLDTALQFLMHAEWSAGTLPGISTTSRERKQGAPTGLAPGSPDGSACQIGRAHV